MSIATKRFLLRLARTAAAAGISAVIGVVLAAGADRDTPASVAMTIGFLTPLLTALDVWVRQKASEK